MVKDVEGLGAKLEMYTLIAFGQGEIFKEGYVRVFSPWLAHAGDGAWSIAESKWRDGGSVLQDADIIASGSAVASVGKIARS